MTETLPPVRARPYAWPFDGNWRATDTALLLLGYDRATELDAAAQVTIAATLAAASRAAGIAVFASHRGSPTSLAFALTDTMFAYGGDNAFYGTGLADALRANGIRNLILAGLPTDGLLHTTMRNANDIGFECLAIADACKGTTVSRHEAQLRITIFGNGLFGCVAESADLLRALA